MPPTPTANAFSTTATRWAGPEALDPDDANLHTLLAQLVDDVLDCPEHGAQRDDHGLGVIRTVGPDQPTRVPPECLFEVGGDLWHEVERLHLLRVHEVSDLEERLRADHRPDRDRLARGQAPGRVAGWGGGGG